MVGTHPHADHIGGLSAIIENFEVLNPGENVDAEYKAERDVRE